MMPAGRSDPPSVALAPGARTWVDGAVDLWLASEAQLDDAASAAHCTALLSDDERAQAQRMKAEGARRQHVLARALQRTVLASHLPGADPRGLRFNRTGGRPSLAAPFDDSALEFNLSHAPGLVVLAVTRAARIGVDVEPRDREVRLSVAEKYFSAGEVADLGALPPAARPERFLRLWTLKEAYLKAMGTGIVGGLGSMTFRFDSGQPCRFERAADPQAANWWFGQFAVGESHLLAVAVLAGTASPSLAWQEFRIGTFTGPPLALRMLP